MLAGGRSRRFGRDKLAEPLFGRPLLHRAILALAAVCAEVIVAGPPEPAVLSRLPALSVPLRVVHDPEPDGGPLVGVCAGLEAGRWPLAMVVGGDMPELAPALLAEMLRALSEGPDAVALCEADRLRPLPCALRASTLAVVRRQLDDGRRSLHELLAVLSTRQLDEPAWRAFDPRAGTLRDIDRPEDLG